MDVRIVELGCGDGKSSGSPYFFWHGGGNAEAIRPFYPHPDQAIHVLGIDVERVKDFEIRKIRGRRITFKSLLGTDVDSIIDESIDAILWRYPDPWSLDPPSNIVELFRLLVRDKLKKRGHFFFQTDTYTAGTPNEDNEHTEAFMISSFERLQQIISEVGLIRLEVDFSIGAPHWSHLPKYAAVYQKLKLNHKGVSVAETK